MDDRAREMLDAIDGYSQVMVRAEAARLAAIVEFLVAYRVLGDYTGPGTERTMPRRRQWPDAHAASAENMHANMACRVLFVSGH